MDLSPVERAALEYCAPRGIPLSVFIDQRVVYPGDPQWTGKDAAAALWWQAEQDKRCDGCGGNLVETLDPDNEDRYRAEGVWCHRCRAIQREALAMAGKNPYSDADPTAGARYRIIENPLIEEVA
jgi:hypothetical protein